MRDDKPHWRTPRTSSDRLLSLAVILSFFLAAPLVLADDIPDMLPATDGKRSNRCPNRCQALFVPGTFLVFVSHHNTRWVYDGAHAVLEWEDSDGQGLAQPLRLANRFTYGDAVDMLLADEQYASGQGPAIGSSSNVTVHRLARLHR
jgi:hypothetical protein